MYNIRKLFRKPFAGKRLLIGIEPKGTDSMLGAGVKHGEKTYFTHSTLPLSQSALETFSKKHKAFLIFTLFIFLSIFIFSPLRAFQIALGILSILYFLDTAFNLFVNIKSLRSNQEIETTEEEISKLKNKNLPTYTILCPLYKEWQVVPQFLESIEKLDWPKNKLDVLLLLEEDDSLTLEEVNNMSLPSYVRTVIVPDSEPKTKPKACNYGLAFAKGEYLVIYDAEDHPDPLQLKKAYIGFKKAGKDIKCLQAKLNYYNPHQNLLTRLFTAEYSLWFDVTLTGFQSLNTALPLGGTSNHFKTQDLKDLKGWDPFNVTEDADLGIRLFKKGFKTAIINSTTLEEANSRPKNWVRQRSRWIKGYMQTFLVHNRDLSWLLKRPIHALIFQIEIGGKIAFTLINPILWITTVTYFVFRGSAGQVIEMLYPAPILYMAVTSLVFGNFLFIYYYMIGCAKRGQWSLIKYVFFIPFYWVLLSTAGTLAAYQLFFKPHYWEKTVHGYHLGKKVQKARRSVPIQKIASVLTPGIPAKLPHPDPVYASERPDTLKSRAFGYASRIKPTTTSTERPNEKKPVPSYTSKTYRQPAFLRLYNKYFDSRKYINGLAFVVLAIVLIIYDLLANDTRNYSFDLSAVSMICALLYVTITPLHTEKLVKKFKTTTYVLSIITFIAAAAHLHITQLESINSSLSTIPNFGLLGALFLTHIPKKAIMSMIVNLEAIIGVFKFLPNNSRSTSGLNILIFNWRDTRHAWAGGAETYVQQLAKEWVKEGNKVTIFCGNDMGSLPNEEIDGVTIYRRGGTYLVYVMAFLYYVLRLKGKYDVIIDCENGIPFFTPLYANVPIFLVIHHIHQEVFRKYLSSPAAKFAQFLEADLMPIVYKKTPIVTVSESTKNEIQRLGFTNNRIEIIHNGITENIFRQSEKTPFPSFIFLGRLQYYKNVNVAIRSFAKIVKKHNNAQLVIAGDGEAREDLENLVLEKNLGKNVHFFGKVSEQKKAELLAQSWAAIQPSQIEGWGITVIEANACATPVIASNVNGLRDSVIDGTTGILAKVGSTDEFYNAMESIINDTILRNTLSANALGWSEKFSWNLSAQRFYLSISAALQKPIPAYAFARPSTNQLKQLRVPKSQEYILYSSHD